MTRYLNRISRLLLLQIIALSIMTILRAVTFIAVPYETSEIISWKIVARAFMIGVWFDNVVVCYIMILPIIITTLFTLINHSSRVISKIILVYLFVMFNLVFLISVANIPYFSYFFENINASVYQWLTYPSITFGMLLTEKSYWCFIILYVFVCWGWWKILHLIHFSLESNNGLEIKQKAGVVVMGICLIGAYSFGIRGRLGYNPIKISQAYFCQDPFLNQIGISPTFNMIATTIDLTRPENRALHLMDPDEAFTEAKKIMGLADNGNSGKNNLERLVKKVSSIHEGKNVVIILMESMATDLLGKGDSPFLDSLCTKSIYFENAFSSGNHTNHGIYSTLYSLPVLMSRNMLKGSDVPHIDGLPDILKKEGYTTIFYMTHESQYDNMNAFLRTNGFDMIRSQENFPQSEVVNSFGVPDNFILQYSIKELTELAENRKPFFSVILTISNHPPYIVPDEFKEENVSLEKSIVRYADWSLKEFFENASKTSWFSNTIFVLLGDHGKLLDERECELPQSFNHIPIIIYGSGIQPERKTDFALQMDVAPTILGMMGYGYLQNNFGLDLDNYSREYAFYTGDKYLAVRDKQHLYLYRPSDGEEYCYLICQNGLRKTDTLDDPFKKMKNYLFAMIQSAETFRLEEPRL